jgi:hypothetical protein
MKLLLLHRLLLHGGITVCDGLERSEKEMVVVAYFISLSPTIRVAQLVEALRRKVAGSMVSMEFSIGLFLLAYNRNYYQEHFVGC